MSASSTTRNLVSELRNKGNEHFLRAKKPGLAPAIKRAALTEANKYYMKAKNSTPRNQPGEMASCLKNIGAASMSHAELILGSPEVFQKEKELFFYHLKEGIHSALQALEKSEYVKPENWVSQLKEQIGTFLETVTEAFRDFEMKEKLKLLHRLCSCFDSCASMHFRAVACCYEVLARECFNSAIQAFERDFRESMNLVHECYRPLGQASRWCKEEDFQETVEELQRRAIQQQFICESIQARYIGDCLIEEAIDGSEELNMDAIWGAIDKYMESALLTRELDVEGEATAYSKIGIVYLDILKTEAPCKVYIDRAFHLAESLQPRNLSGLHWYQEVTRAKQYFQEKAVREDNQRREAERGPILEELQPELDALKAADLSAYALLKYVYEKHPPKESAHVLGPLDSDNLKKTLIKAISHYHPDKNAGKDSLQWTVLCEEITKMLNFRYEFFKG
eukprot:gb/GECG01012401.1/.p1 GENE.gb/GECG01012401.1/~~gb/GECG01012401.1/.p1  ORF type:complete len:451 (+),score=65.95 gb/GECG01012401.1/:1-1353(+)